jgi:hypothetical protein
MTGIYPINSSNVTTPLSDARIRALECPVHGRRRHRACRLGVSDSFGKPKSAFDFEALQAWKTGPAHSANAAIPRQAVKRSIPLVAAMEPFLILVVVPLIPES